MIVHTVSPKHMSLILSLALVATLSLSARASTIMGSGTASVETAFQTPASDVGTQTLDLAGTSAVLTGTQRVETATETLNVLYESDDIDVSPTETADVLITLAPNGSTATGNGVQIEGNLITISAAGIYRLTGHLNAGQVIVDAEKVVLQLEAGTESSFSDGAVYAQEYLTSGEPDAALYSKSDLTVTGSGTLIVHGNYRHGIVSKDNLKITDGTVIVDAVSDGIRGRDYVAVRDGTISITAGSDGIGRTTMKAPKRAMSA